MKKSKNILLDNIDSIIEQARTEILPYFSDELGDYSHCIQHADRVIRLAQFLCLQEGGDCLVISLAALFHDIARTMEDRGECTDHAIKGAELAKGFLLLKYNLSCSTIDHVVYCIQNHRTNGSGTTLESKILRDADKLDSLGAICISRVIASSIQSSKYKRPIFDPLIQPEGHETASAIHYLILLTERYKNDDYFITETARKMADERIIVINDFIKQFKKEWFFIKNN